MAALTGVRVLGWAGGGRRAGAWAGLVLGAKAAAQLVCAPLAGAATRRRGPAAVLRAATALLAASAIGLSSHYYLLPTPAMQRPLKSLCYRAGLKLAYNLSFAYLHFHHL